MHTSIGLIEGLMSFVLCCDCRQPDKLRVVWIRRNRRHCTKVKDERHEIRVRSVQNNNALTGLYYVMKYVLDFNDSNGINILLFKVCSIGRRG